MPGRIFLAPLPAPPHADFSYEGMVPPPLMSGEKKVLGVLLMRGGPGSSADLHPKGGLEARAVRGISAGWVERDLQARGGGWADAWRRTRKDQSARRPGRSQSEGLPPVVRSEAPVRAVWPLGPVRGTGHGTPTQTAQPSVSPRAVEPDVLASDPPQVGHTQVGRSDGSGGPRRTAAIQDTSKAGRTLGYAWAAGLDWACGAEARTGIERTAGVSGTEATGTAGSATGTAGSVGRPGPAVGSGSALGAMSAAGKGPAGARRPQEMCERNGTAWRS